jgi:propane monooxygenase small subunit
VPVSSGSALACGDWQAFTGPGARWGRTVERMEAEAESRVAGAVRRAMSGEDFSDVSPQWLDFLRRTMPVAAFAFNECGRILESVSRRSPWGALADGLALQASMQFRQAQSIVLYVADMEQRVGEMPMQTARARWETDRHWLPAHHFLEQAMSCPDWGESLVAVNLCFEPLMGQLLRREMAIRCGPSHGDHVTPVVAETGQSEWRLTRAWTVAICRFLTGDPVHGAANRETLGVWLDRQLPAAQDAARVLAGLTVGLPGHAAGGADVAAVIDDQLALLAEAGLAVA